MEQGACAGIPEPHQGGPSLSVANTLHLHDDRTQSVHLGISHQEFGAVISEAQRLLDESRTRASYFEGVAQEIHSKACEQIQNLKGIVESLYQACESKDQSIQRLGSDLGALQHEVLLTKNQLQSQTARCSQCENLLGHKDSEIQNPYPLNMFFCLGGGTLNVTYIFAGDLGGP